MCLLLVVDDEDLIRESVAEILSVLGHDIIHARDGLEALRIFKTKTSDIHLILMDIMMPRMSGIAAAKAIKQDHPSTKIVLMSGYTDEIPSEADAFLSKPFRGKDLRDVIQKILGVDDIPSSNDLKSVQRLAKN